MLLRRHRGRGTRVEQPRLFGGLSGATARAAPRVLRSGRAAEPVDFLAVERRGVFEDLGRERDLVVAQVLEVFAPAGGDARINWSDSSQQRIGVGGDLHATAVDLIARAGG